MGLSYGESTPRFRTRPQQPRVELAVLNVAVMHGPLDSEIMREFVRNLDPINQLADESPGFIWRHSAGPASPGYASIPESGEQLLLANLSVWTDLDSLKRFAYRSAHVELFRQRRRWFRESDEVNTVCWWVPVGERPDLSDAYRRLRLLREHGPSASGWSLRKPFATEGDTGASTTGAGDKPRRVPRLDDNHFERPGSW